MKSRFLASAALAVITAAAQAQQVVPFQGDLHAAPWTAPVSDPGPFGRGVAGHFTADDVLDVVQLDGTHAVLLTNPDEFLAASEMASGVTDLARVPCAGLGVADALAVVGPAGLELVWYDPVGGSFVRVMIDAGAWAGAVLVRSADLNEDGASDLIGVAADGRTVLVRHANPAGGPVFDPATGFVADGNVRDLLVLHWDADAPVEVALLTDLAVDVHDLGGTRLNRFTGTATGGAICVLGQDGLASERIAWITEYAPPAQQFLTVLQPSGATDLVDLGGLDAFAVVPTDYDLDGDDDILISHKFSYELLWIENERSPQKPYGPSFQMASDQVVFPVEQPGPAPENEAWPVVGDFDGDGDDDVSFASDGSQQHFIFRGEPIDQDAYRIGLSAADYTLPGGQGLLTLTLQAPPVIPAGATHLELRAWRQESLSAPVDPDVLDVVTLPLPASWPTTASIALPETDASFSAVYDLHLRLVDLDPLGGALLDAHPARIGTFVLLAADRTQLTTEEPTATGIPVTLPLAPEPEQDPSITKRKRVKLPPAPPQSGVPGVPNLNK